MLHVVGQPPGPQPATSRPRRLLLRTILGEVLRRARREQRRTLAEVSRDARVSMQYLSELERGRKEASSEVLAAVCDALGLDLAYLLTEVGRQLAEDRARQATVIRLGNLAGDRAVPGGRAQPPRPMASGEIDCLLAA
jgi:transcriptional regulator with XRE-family HTH domain